MNPCPVCLQNYHSENVVPVVLNACGHTLCRRCLQQIINTTTLGHISRCPTCRAGIDNNGFVTNWALIANNNPRLPRRNDGDEAREGAGEGRGREEARAEAGEDRGREEARAEAGEDRAREEARERRGRENCRNQIGGLRNEAEGEDERGQDDTPWFNRRYPLLELLVSNDIHNLLSDHRFREVSHNEDNKFIPNLTQQSVVNKILEKIRYHCEYVQVVDMINQYPNQWNHLLLPHWFLTNIYQGLVKIRRYHEHVPLVYHNIIPIIF